MSVIVMAKCGTCHVCHVRSGAGDASQRVETGRMRGMRRRHRERRLRQRLLLLLRMLMLMLMLMLRLMLMLGEVIIEKK